MTLWGVMMLFVAMPIHGRFERHRGTQAQRHRGTKDKETRVIG